VCTDSGKKVTLPSEPADKQNRGLCVTFLLFVLSAVVIEAILAFDQRRERKRQASLPVTAKAAEQVPETSSEGLLPLLEALDKHGRGATPQKAQPARDADLSPTDSAYNRENVRPE
jgi:hypothetical protein